MKKLLLGLSSIFIGLGSLQAQFSLTSSNYTQNFDGLGLTSSSALTGGSLGLLNANLNGWYFYETNATAKNIITVGTGSSGTGDTYNVGTNNTSTDRSIGSLQSSGEVPRFGFWFQNDTGATITGLSLSYRGETWRIGATGRSDSLTFATSTDASALNLGTWTDNVNLGYTNNSAGATSTAGGSVLQSANISGNLGVLSLATGSKMFLRWTDFNASGADDLLAINNFSLTATLAEIAASYGWSGGGGTWQNGQSGLFGSTYSNATNNSVTFSGTSGAVTVSGNVEAGSLTFSSSGYELNSGNLKIGQGSVTTDAGTTTINSVLEGASGLTKAGVGTLVLTGANMVSGAVSITAGTLQIGSDGALGDVANDVANNGTLKTTSNISLGAGRDLSGSGTLDIASGTTLTINGNVNNTATTLANSGTLNLQGTTRSVGNLTVNAAGTVNGAGAVNATGLTASGLSSGTAAINTDIIFTSGDKTLNVAGGTLDLNGVLSNGGGTGRIAKTGSGSLVVSAANNMGGLRIGAAGSTMTDGGEVILESSVVGSQAQAIQHNFGTLRAGTALTITNGISIGGRSTGAATLAGSDMEFQGQSAFFRGTGTTGQFAVNVNNTTTLSGGLAATSGGGTATGLDLGGTGTLKITGNSSAFTDTITTKDTVKLVVNSTLGAGVNVGSGSLLGGSGTIGALTVTTGGTLTPGNSPGLLTAASATFQSGSILNWEIYNASGTAGVEWDLLSVTGDLNVSALSSGSMNLVLKSLSALPDTVGALAGYTSTTPYSWIFAQAATITGVGAGDGLDVSSLFNINTSSFNNGTGPDQGWKVVTGSVTVGGNTLRTLELQAVPEPSSSMLMVVGLAGLIGIRAMRRKSS